MLADCHIHMLLDGNYYKDAIARHAIKPDDSFIRRTLENYRRLGYTYLRDGGDRWGAGARARALAGEYGISYTSPIFPIYKVGHYGSFIGKGFATMEEYRSLVAEVKEKGGDFIKIMISGLMDFDHYGVLTSQGLEWEEIREMVHIAHSEGFAVMAHANGAETVIFGARAGVDSIEHGAYLNREALQAMVEAGTIWVPTLSTVGNLLGDGRYGRETVEKILASALQNVAAFSKMGGLLAPGSDAGAYRVFHGEGGFTERKFFVQALGELAGNVLDRGTQAIMAHFQAK